jgi:hypothetical protein
VHQGDELGSAEEDIGDINAAGSGLGKFEQSIGVEGSWDHIKKKLQTCSIEGAPSQHHRNYHANPVMTTFS